MNPASDLVVRRDARLVVLHRRVEGGIGQGRPKDAASMGSTRFRLGHPEDVPNIEDGLGD